MPPNDNDANTTNLGDPELLKKAKRSRIGAKTWLTRAKDDLLKLFADGKVPDDVVILEEKLTELEKRIASYENTQSEVEQWLADDDLAGDIFQEASYLSPVEDARVKAIKAIRELNKPIVVDAALNDDDAVSSVSSKTRKQHVKVPKIDIPPFYGGYLEFSPFWDRYKVTIHDNSDLATITKFSHLTTLLKGEAEQVIKGLTITEENYTLAIDLLKKRYDRKEEIIFGHLQSLLKLSVNDGNIRAFTDQLLIHIRGLENKEIKGDTYGVILTPMILSRLPPETMNEWARESEGNEGNLTFLLEFLEKELERVDRAKSFGNLEAGDKKSTRKSNAVNLESATPTAAALTAQSDSNREASTTYTSSKKKHQHQLHIVCMFMMKTLIHRGKHKY